MKRNGKPLATLRDGHPRRMADARNAFRKMNDQQRIDFLTWLASADGPGLSLEVMAALRSSAVLAEHRDMLEGN